MSGHFSLFLPRYFLLPPLVFRLCRPFNRISGLFSTFSAAAKVLPSVFLLLTTSIGCDCHFRSRSLSYPKRTRCAKFSLRRRRGSATRAGAVFFGRGLSVFDIIAFVSTLPRHLYHTARNFATKALSSRFALWRRRHDAFSGRFLFVVPWRQLRKRCHRKGALAAHHESPTTNAYFEHCNSEKFPTTTCTILVHIHIQTTGIAIRITIAPSTGFHQHSFFLCGFRFTASSILGVATRGVTKRVLMVSFESSRTADSAGLGSS